MIEKYRGRPLKRAPHAALRLTHVRERKLAVAPFRLLIPGKAILEDRFLYSGGTDSLENFTAEFSASAPVVYKNLPPLSPDMLYTTGAGEGVKVSVAIFPSSGGGV